MQGVSEILLNKFNISFRFRNVDAGRGRCGISYSCEHIENDHNSNLGLSVIRIYRRGGACPSRGRPHGAAPTSIIFYDTIRILCVGAAPRGRPRSDEGVAPYGSGNPPLNCNLSISQPPTVPPHYSRNPHFFQELTEIFCSCLARILRQLRKPYRSLMRNRIKQTVTET